MDFVDALTLLGGVALFLFGMTLMGDALKLVAGNKLELILYRLSGTPIKGILLGTGVTAVIQSSSATSVMVVGFVNSGMMKINQAISIIMGAIIGTSVTGWIISLSDISGGGGILSLFSTEVLSAITAIIGIYLRMFNKERNKQHIGDILLGFSILMFGMKSMSSSVSDLRNSEVFINLLTKFTNPFLGILIGLIFTTIIQSASAAIGILQALSATGAITFEIALPIIMGIAIGAAVPVLLSAFGATVEGKRTAVSYLVVDFLGSLIFSIIFYSLNFFFHFSFMSTPLRSVNIALINTVFRVAIVLILMPSINIIENIISMLIKDEAVSSEAELDEINSLEERFISYPPLAVENSKLAIRKMGELALKNIYDALDLLVLSYSDDGYKEVERIENIIDKYEDKYNTNVDMNKILTEQKELINKKEQEKIIQEKSVYYDKNESRLLSFQKENAIFKLSEQNTKVCYEEGFKNILFEMYIDSLALDRDFINENYKSINNFFMTKLNEFANNNISELIEKCSSSKPIKEISKACKKKARKKSDDAIQKANNASTVEEINDIFNDSMNDDNKPEKDDIGVDPEQIANDVNCQETLL